jgi:hypothetical protein
LNHNFQINCRHSTGNLHIELFGDFNDTCAWELFKIIRRHADSRRVFVNTIGVRQVAGDGVKLFRSQMTRKRLPHDWLYFKGKKGFKIAPGGSRVLICNKGSKPIQNRPHHINQTIMKRRLLK